MRSTYFRKYLKKKTAVRSAAKSRVHAHKLRIHLVCSFLLPRSKGQVTRSGQSQMCTPGPASNVKFVLCHSFSPNVFKLSGLSIGVDTYRMHISYFSF